MGVRSAKFSPSSRPSKGRQQVAAVCYRMGRRGLEFLLVQTRGGRWIFPKGGVEPGLTHAQSAALEAFEEAGVHGRIEAAAFARYFRGSRRPARKNTRAGAAREESGVIAHLCEVTRLEPPQESNRNPTWFSAQKAKLRLRKDRTPEFGAELTHVVDRALSRIQRLHDRSRQTPDPTRKDALQKVRFEAHEDGRLHDDLRNAVLARYILRQRDARSPAIIEAAVQAHFRKPPSFGGASDLHRPVLRLSAGANSTTETARNITAINSKRRAGGRTQKS